MDILRISILVKNLTMKRLKICLAFAMVFIFAVAISQIKKPPLPPLPPGEMQMAKPTEPQKVIIQKLNHPPIPPKPPIPPPPPPPPPKENF